MVRTPDLFMSTVPLKKKIKKLGKTTNLGLIIMTIFHIGVEHFQQFSEWMSADFYGVISNSVNLQENLVIWWRKKNWQDSIEVHLCF